MIKLGITGGIGSGKSFVSRCLKKYYQLEIYDTDSAAKRLMWEHEGIRADLKALLGEKVYEGGGLNKQLLADYIFSDSVHAENVNSIVHPRVKEDFRDWCRALEEKECVAVESAILFESGFDEEVDQVLVVSAPLELRVRRVMDRDGVKYEQVMARIAAQIAEEERLRRADYVIMNDGIQDLGIQLKDVFFHLCNRKAK